MSYITLDTGLNGAMVLWDEFFNPLDGLTFKKFGMGINPFEIDKKLKEWKAEKIYIERVGARPNQGSKSTFTQGFVCGQLHTISQFNCDHVEYIWSMQWTSFTKKLSAFPENPSKIIALELAERFFPCFIQDFKTPRSKKAHDGIVDCLAIGIYINRDNYIDFLP